MSKLILRTPRLLLREFESGDMHFILRLLNSPGWLAFIGDRNVHTAEDAHDYLANGPQKSYAQNGFGLWAVEETASGELTGMCGLIRRDTLEDVDIGFAFLPEYEGKGFAFEAASATLVFAKSTLQLPRVVAITVPGNRRSIRLLEKTGMRFEKMIRMGEEDLMLFST